MTSTPPPAPVLVAEDLRVDVDGVPVCDGLTLASRGERVLVLGGPRALYLAAAGLLPVVRGKLVVRLRAPTQAVAERLVASASLDVPLPARWTLIEYVTWSARLAGHGRSAAASLAQQALERLELAAFAKVRLGKLVAAARRAVPVAAAVATGAKTLVIEDPLAGMAEEVGRAWATILASGLDGLGWVVFAARVSLTSPLALAADEALLVNPSRLDAQGPPAELASGRRRFVARLHGPVDALAQALASRGARVEEAGRNPTRVVVDLGASLRTTDLFALSEACGVVIVELYALAHALA